MYSAIQIILFYPIFIAFYPIFTHSRPILSHSHLKNCVKPPFEPFVLKRFFGGYGCKCLKIRKKYEKIKDALCTFCFGALILEEFVQ